MGTCRLPRPRDDLGLAEHSAELVYDSALDLARRHASDLTRTSTLIQHGLWADTHIPSPQKIGFGPGYRPIAAGIILVPFNYSGAQRVLLRGTNVGKSFTVWFGAVGSVQRRRRSSRAIHPMSFRE